LKGLTSGLKKALNEECSGRKLILINMMTLVHTTESIDVQNSWSVPKLPLSQVISE